MSVIQPAPRSSRASSSPRWSWAHFLALIALPLLVWETWTVAAWLADGPRQITEFRDSDDVSWYAARAMEALAILISIAVLAYLVRGCRRERRLFTFDVMFCLASGSAVWLDMTANFFVPTFLPSSNWVNVNSMCGNMPLVVNPECGTIPHPILFLLLLYVFGILGVAILFQLGLNRARARWHRFSQSRMMVGVVAVFAASFALDLAFEPLSIALHLWTYPAPEWMSLGLGHGFRFPVLEFVAAGLWFGMLAALWIFKDDRGRTLSERGLERHTPRNQRAIAMLAVYAYCQVAMLAAGVVPLWFFAPYEPAWPKYPAHILNNFCDAPGVSGTRYGPCPGTPGWRMPVRGSLNDGR